MEQLQLCTSSNSVAVVILRVVCHTVQSIQLCPRNHLKNRGIESYYKEDIFLINGGHTTTIYKIIRIIFIKIIIWHPSSSNALTFRHNMTQGPNQTTIDILWWHPCKYTVFMLSKFLLLTPRALKGTVVGVKSLCYKIQQSVKIKLLGKIIVKQQYR